MRGRLQTAVDTGVGAVRRNAKPFLFIQSLAVALAFAYYLVPAVRASMAEVGEAKAHGGLPLSALTTVLASVALPEVARLATGRDRSRSADLAFQVAYFAVIGVIVDLFYRGLGVLFGNDPGFVTVGEKLFVDQFLFSTVLMTPLAITAFLWKDVGFSPARTVAAFRAGGGFFARWLPTMVTNWAYWMPVLAVVYSMPVGLQFVLFLPLQAAWSLILVELNTATAKR